MTMTISEMRRVQHAAEKAMSRKGVDLPTKIAFNVDIATWEIAIQLATLNDTLKRFLAKRTA